MFDPLISLREAGLPVDQLSSAQQSVLASLTEDEAAVLVSVQSRLAKADAEVMAHDLKLL
jgi:hypothetical protein